MRIEELRGPDQLSDKLPKKLKGTGIEALQPGPGDQGIVKSFLMQLEACETRTRAIRSCIGAASHCGPSALLWTVQLCFG